MMRRIFHIIFNIAVSCDKSVRAYSDARTEANGMGGNCMYPKLHILALFSGIKNLNIANIHLYTFIHLWKCLTTASLVLFNKCSRNLPLSQFKIDLENCAGCE